MDVERALEQQAEHGGDDERRRQGGNERRSGALHQEYSGVAARHGEGTVRQVDEIHQPQCHGEPAGQHEQQHAVGQAVEQDGGHL
jgi:hypothetical protein